MKRRTECSEMIPLPKSCIPLISLLAMLSFHASTAQVRSSANNHSANGYKGIWFTLNQFSAWGDKYSGGLGTYTAHHIPMAVYAPEVNKTFFVYGGTTSERERHLLCMIGTFDHADNTVTRPVVVHDKGGVDDPHDNPSIMLDDRGYIWVFVSGRGNARKGYKYRSVEPYNTRSFEQITEEVMTYPQPIYVADQGYFHFFTKYTGVRELYFEKSGDGITWTDDVKLAGIRKPVYERSGHYQVSNHAGNKLFTFFNWHPNGNVDKRTNIYYAQTTDFGESFETVAGEKLTLPLEDIISPALAMNYERERKNVYLCDAVADVDGNPMCLYVISDGHEPGPQNGKREWRLLAWDGQHWADRKIAESDHNYDMGSLFIDSDAWTMIAPTENGPQPHGAGGEIVIWESRDRGATWKRKKQITHYSTLNHNYVRRVVNGQSPFLYFWADGNPNAFSPSYLYFGDARGRVWQLPYQMDGEKEKPRRMH